MIDGEQKPDQLDNEPFYVGAPTEFADAQEMPGWVQRGIKVIVALPALIAALSVLELIAFCGIAILIVLGVLFFAVL